MVRIIRRKGKLATAEMNRPAAHEERKQDLEGTNTIKTKNELNDEQLEQVSGGKGTCPKNLT